MTLNIKSFILKLKEKKKEKKQCLGIHIKVIRSLYRKKNENPMDIAKLEKLMLFLL